MSRIDQADRALMDNKAPVITEAMQAEQTRNLTAALDKLGATALRIKEERDAMAKALQAVLLFHGAHLWTPDVRSDWKELTGEDEATTRVLCDTVRAALAKANL